MDQKWGKSIIQNSGRRRVWENIPCCWTTSTR